MHRLLSIVLATLLAASLTANAMLGWVAWRSQREYRALAAEFVRVRQAQKAATAPVSGQVAEPQVRPPRAEAAQTNTTTPATGESSPATVAPAHGSSQDEVAAVWAGYQPRFEALQRECEGALSGLLDQAKAEYSAARAAGSKVDVAALGAKYFSRAESLKATCDGKVEALLSQMRSDLRVAGLPTDLVDKVRQAYQARVVERQAEMTAKAGG